MMNFYVLTIRSPVQDDKSLSDKIATWIQSLGAKEVIILTSELDYSSQFVDPYSG